MEMMECEFHKTIMFIPLINEDENRNWIECVENEFVKKHQNKWMYGKWKKTAADSDTWNLWSSASFHHKWRLNKRSIQKSMGEVKEEKNNREHKTFEVSHKKWQLIQTWASKNLLMMNGNWLQYLINREFACTFGCTAIFDVLAHCRANRCGCNSHLQPFFFGSANLSLFCLLIING